MTIVVLALAFALAAFGLTWKWLLGALLNECEVARIELERESKQNDPRC